MKRCYTHKGFTLVELLIVIVVIGILSAMMMIAANEFIASAKANNIIANLTTLKKATLAWYMDNLDKVVASNGKLSNGKSAVKGMVVINNNPKPVQECKDQDLKLSIYINNMGATGINMNSTYKDKNTGNTNTDLQEGCYGVCDGGGKAKKRHIWYVGYRFKDSESAVKEKIKGRMKSLGLFFGTSDAHEDSYNDNSAAVWLHVLSM